MGKRGHYFPSGLWRRLAKDGGRLPKAKAKAGGGAAAEATQRLGSNFLAREIKAVR